MRGMPLNSKVDKSEITLISNGGILAEKGKLKEFVLTMNCFQSHNGVTSRSIAHKAPYIASRISLLIK